jgi:hypothetical protein
MPGESQSVLGPCKERARFYLEDENTMLLGIANLADGFVMRA